MIKLDSSGAIKAASTIMQAFYGQRILELQALSAKQDAIMVRKLEVLWERIQVISDSPMEAVIILADLMTYELDRRVTVVMA